MFKRGLAVILLIAIVVALVGCSAKSAPSTVSSTPAVSNSTVPVTTTAPTTIPTTVPTTGEHKHAYRATTLKQATCTADGTMYFDCDCGHNYTETIKAKGHKWGQWLQVVSTSGLEPTGTYRTCSRCKSEERSLYYNNMLKKYTTLVGCIGHSFSSSGQVSANDAARALPMVMSVLPEFTDDPSIATRTYTVSELNKIAKKCLGKTFDFSGVQNLSMYGYGTISYVASKNALVWTFPYGQSIQRDSAVFESAAANEDNTKFTVTFHYEYVNGSKSDACTFTVEYKNSNYVITSVSQ